MSIEVRPLGVKCNIQCQYCYQNPQRDAGNIPNTFDLPKMKAALERAGSHFTIFGGEPLLVPEHVLEELWAFGLERFGTNGIQTNGTLINDRHIALFKKYKVIVGISVDGPDDLNDVRWAGSVELTREATAKTHAAIERLVREGLTPSLIVTLHRNNATADKLPRMRDWFRYLDTLGITSVRLHDLEIEESRRSARSTGSRRTSRWRRSWSSRRSSHSFARCDSTSSPTSARCCSARTTTPRASGMPATRTIRGRSRASRGTDSAATAAGRTRTASTSSKPTAKGSNATSRSTTRRRKPVAATIAGSS